MVRRESVNIAGVNEHSKGERFVDAQGRGLSATH